MNMSKPLFLALALASPLALAQGVTNNVKQMETTAGPLTVTWGQPALAKESEYHVRFADLDVNHDGKVSRDEIPSGHALEFEFKVVDTNHNGSLSEQELASWH
jgi:hypothetical protein